MFEKIAEQVRRGLGNMISAGDRQTAIHGKPVMVVPPDVKVVTDFEALSNRPYSLAQKVTVKSLDAFVAYYARFAMTRSVIFADDFAGQLVGIIDYHDAPAGNTTEAAPNWCRHTVTFAPPQTESFVDWCRANGTWLSQDAFADHVDDRADDFVAPKGAQMLAIATRFKATKSVKFESGKNLQSGDIQLVFIEETSAKGNIDVPATFTIQLQPFRNSNVAYKLDAKLRYRISEGGALSLMYRLPKLQEMKDQAFTDMVKDLSKRLPKASIFIGKHA